MTSTFKERVIKRLKKLDMTPSGASAKAGLDRKTLPNLLDSDDSEPHPRTARKLADALETTPQWLLYGNGAEEPEQTEEVDHTLFTETEIRRAIESILESAAMRNEAPAVVAGLVISIMVERRRKPSTELNHKTR